MKNETCHRKSKNSIGVQLAGTGGSKPNLSKRWSKFGTNRTGV